MKNSKIREKDVEKYLVRKFLSVLNGKAYKYNSPSRRSVPDRILLWIPRGANEGRCVFVECKAPGKTWTPNQARERDRHIDLGQEVYMVDTFDAVDELITHLRLKF